MENVATLSNFNGPYLYKTPSCIRSCSHLLELLQIPDSFGISKLLEVLTIIYKDDHSLNQKELIEAITIELKQINDKLPAELDQFDCIVLPDMNYVLTPIKRLVINDVHQWIPVPDGYVLLNPIINPKRAVALGVKKIDRGSFLEKYSCEIQIEEYGQSEELTHRIQSILHDYPLDETLLYELMQNADDAKASEMYLILDKRKHGEEKIFSPNWKELQGPALLVWNNGEFTEKDMEGLQKLGLGSKRGATDSIGQFGIGFNVVYHITDCPSFIANGETMCILDPHSRYVNDNVTHKRRGKRLSNLSKDFWEPMSDVADAYLLNDNFEEEQHAFNPLKGTLFRLPLRCSASSVQQTTFSDDSEEFAAPVICNQFEKDLNSWVTCIKEAMIFLQHLKKFKYVVIDSTGKFCPKVSYEVEVDCKVRHEYIEAITSFKEYQEPYLKLYNFKIKVKTENLKKSEKHEETWLGQHGIGHLKKSFKDSGLNSKRYASQIPTHAIAVQLDGLREFKPKVFCSLPLPILSTLPVHINGSFELGTNRRSLWSGSHKDDKSKWNSFIFDALSIAYCVFLEGSFTSFVSLKYVHIHDTKYHQDLEKYYKIFPTLGNMIVYKNSDDIGIFEEFTKFVLQYLAQRSSKILVSSKQDEAHSEITVKLHKLNSHKIFFGPRPDDNDMIPLFKIIGMHLTDAPLLIYDQLKEFCPTLLFAKVEDVFKFYCENYDNIFTSIPCKVSDSSFSNVVNFRDFVFYLMELDKKTGLYTFPREPFKYPLLLTADEMIRKFHKHRKVLQSDYSKVFSKSLEYFLHTDMIMPDTPLMDSSYFLTSGEITLSFMEKLFEENFPHLKYNSPHQESVTDEIKSIWKCFSKDESNFSNEIIDHITAKWKLLPASNGEIYTSSSSVRPLVPLAESHKDYNFYRCFSKYGMPVLVEDICLSFPKITKYCLDASNLRDNESVLKGLCEVCKHTGFKKMFDELVNNREDLKIIVEYLSKISYRGQNSNLLQMLKRLPIFETVCHTLTHLDGKKVYLWPNEFCTSGYEKWLPSDNDVVFLDLNGCWSMVCDHSLIVSEIDMKRIYQQFVMEKFDQLACNERLQQLRFARDDLLPYAVIDANKAKKKKSCRIANDFIGSLCKLRCIKHGTDFHSIEGFCLETIEIFKIIPENFMFLPQEYNVDDQEWLNFFITLGIRTELKPCEFITLCKNVLNSNLDLHKATNILLKYLFSEKTSCWFSNSYIIEEISEIKFLPRVAQDIEGLCLSTTFSNDELVSLKESAVLGCQQLIWMVKPVIRLPHDEIGKQYQYEEHLKALNVTTTPSSCDVYENICKVSSVAQLSNCHLFDQQPFKQFNFSFVIKSIKECLLFLERVNAHDYLEEIYKIPCLPVPSSLHLGANKQVPQIVLVKPTQVVRQMTDKEQKDFFPYVHVIPKYFTDVGFVLSVIGVEENISMQHMIMILAMVHDHSVTKSQLDPNQISVVRNALIKFGKLFIVSHYAHDCEINQAWPNTDVFLPVKIGEKWRMCKSTEVVFCNLTRYDHLSFENQCFVSVFKIPPETSATVHSEIPTGAGISLNKEMAVYLGLSYAQRPKCLSKICREEIIESGIEDQKVKGSFNPLFLHISRFKKHKYSRQVQSILQSLVCDSGLPQHDVVKCFSSNIFKLLNSLELILLEKLNVELIYTKENKRILSFEPNIYLQETEGSKRNKLFIAQKATAQPAVLLEVAEVICLQATKCNQELQDMGEELMDQFKSTLQECLKVSSYQEMKSLCERYNVKIEESLTRSAEEKTSKSQNDDDIIELIPELGVCIPEIVCDLYLDRNECNLYKPQEWVGYEISEEIFIWAIILYKNENDLTYTIMVTKKDRKTVTEIAPTDKLCKFILTDEADSESDSQDYDTLDKKKLEILKTLKNNSEIKENLVRRLYIKYHPDAVGPSNKPLYRKLHMYLITQLTRLENGDKPSLNISDEKYVSQCPWAVMFPHWDMHVHRIKRNRSKRSSRKIKFSLPEEVSTTLKSDSEKLTVKNITSGTTADVITDGKKIHFQPVSIPEEARRWLRQAIADYEVMKTTVSSPCHQLFLAHETIEKSLKAVVYQLVGLNPSFLKHHDIKCHAHAICSLKPEASTFSLKEIVERVQDNEYYVKSRFPNQIDDGKAPVDVYKAEEAAEIVRDAGKVLEFCKKLVDVV